MTQPFNAWRDPWLPVVNNDGPQIVSLRDLFADAGSYTALGADLTPIDRDSLYRFLPAVAAMIARNDSDYHRTGTLDAAAIDQFEDRWSERFDLTGPKPFMQHWTLTGADLDAAGENAMPLARMFPHVPGSASSLWMQRRDTRTVDDWATITLCLIVLWFQTRHGNKKDPWGIKHTKGSAASYHVNPMAVYYTHPDSLGATIAANTPLEWLDSTDVPMFFNHEQPPIDLSTVPGSLYRFTYARMLPILHLDSDGNPDGFTIAATEYPVPLLGETEAESLAAIHEIDHTRLPNLSAKAASAVAMGSFRARVTSTAGFTHWFRSDARIAGADGAFDAWRRIRRAARINGRERWLVSVFSGSCEKKGGPYRWCDWSTFPLTAAGDDPIISAQLFSIAEAVGAATKTVWGPLKTAFGDKRKKSDLQDKVTADIYALCEPVIANTQAAIAANGAADVANAVAAIRAAGIKAFTAGVDPLRTPLNQPALARAIGSYQRNLDAELATRNLTPTPSKD